MSHLHALLVGINTYPDRPLKGCVHDALAWQSYLEERVGKEGRLSLELLLDEEATRARLIEAFRRHLGQAREGDTALFCFSGHGSEEAAQPPYFREEPGGRSETLLAHDSRLEGGLDLADKELAVLIAEVALHGAHVVVVLDCCHSGTATRYLDEEEETRRMAARRWRRPEGSYWFQEEGAAVPAELDAAGGWRVLPAGPHVLLSACEDYQKAKECTPADGRKRGLFSYHLLRTLERLGPGTTYRELFKETRTRVLNQVPHQRPQAEGELDATVFRGTVAARPERYHVSLGQDVTWWLDAGSVHAIQEGCEVAVLAQGAPGADALSHRLGTARVVEVQAARSRLEVEGELPKHPPAHPATVTRLPHPVLRVALDGEAEAVARLRRHVAGSPYLGLAPDPASAGVVAHHEKADWHLKRPGASGDLTAPLTADEAGEREVVEALEHIARWQTLADLANPESPLLEALEMTVCLWSPPMTPGGEPDLLEVPAEGELRLPYLEEPHEVPRPRRICVRLANRLDRPLYYALLALEESFAVGLLERGAGRLAGGEEVWVGHSRGIPATVPDRHHVQGVTQRRTLLLLLVSATEADFGLLEQARLEPGGAGRPVRGGRGPRPVYVEDLFRSTAYRELSAGPPPVAHQWAARTQAVVSVRPLAWRHFTGDGQARELVPGVRLRIPPGLEGAVRLHGPASAPGFPGVAGLTVAERSLLRPVTLAGALGSDPGLSAVELCLTDWSLVSEGSPLVLETEVELEEVESLAAVAWDGETSRLNRPGTEEPPPGTCSIHRLTPPRGDHETLWLELYALQVTGG